MTTHAIYDGGNELQHYDSNESGASGYDNIRPASHHIQRNRTILFHANTGDRPFINDWNPLKIYHNDEILTHLIGAGWVIRRVGIHIKQAGVGTLEGVIISGSGDRIPLVDYKAPEPEAGTTPVSAKVNLAQVGFRFLKPAEHGEYLNESGIGNIGFKYSGVQDPETKEYSLLNQGCFGVVLELVYLEDERACNCVTIPCPTEFPSPECAPDII